MRTRPKHRNGDIMEMGDMAALCRWLSLLALLLYENSVSEDVDGIEAHVDVLPDYQVVACGR